MENFDSNQVQDEPYDFSFNNPLLPPASFNPNLSQMNQEYLMNHFQSYNPNQNQQQQQQFQDNSLSHLQPPAPPSAPTETLFSPTQQSNNPQFSMPPFDSDQMQSSQPPSFARGAAAQGSGAAGDVEMNQLNGFLDQDRKPSWTANSSDHKEQDSIMETAPTDSKRGKKRRKDNVSANPKKEMEQDKQAEEGDSNEQASGSGAGRKKNMGLPPAKRACTFCRNRKSRCDGNQPCGACTKRKREDECIFTVSRRGGRPKDKSALKKTPSTSKTSKERSTSKSKSKDRSSREEKASTPVPKKPVSEGGDGAMEEDMEDDMEDDMEEDMGDDMGDDDLQEGDWENPELQNHLTQLFTLSSLPQNVRVPGAVPQLAGFQNEQQPGIEEFQDFNFDFSWPLVGFENGQLNPQMQGIQAGGGNQGLGMGMGMQMGNQMQNSNPQATEVVSNMSSNGINGFNSISATQFHQQSSNGLSSSPTQATHASTSPSNWINHMQENSGLSQSPPQTQQPRLSPSGVPHPSIPQTETPILRSQEPAHSSTSASQPPLATSRASRVALLAEYYKSLYRFIPVVLPASVPGHLEILEQKLPPTEESPLLLSLQAILPLLRERNNPGQKSPEGNVSKDEEKSQTRKRMLRVQAAWYERKATDALESILERADNEGGDTEMGNPDSHFTSGERSKGGEGAATIEVIQALCVLTIYHYGSGRALKARLKADQALGLAMANGLHRLSQPQPFSPTMQNARRATPSSPKSSFVSLNGSTRPRTGSESSSHMLNEDPRNFRFTNELESETFEMKKRCWWTVWTLVLWSAYNTGRIPTVRADDPRVSCEMPIQGDGEIQTWFAHTRSLQTLLLVQERVLALSHLQSEGAPSPPSAGLPDAPNQQAADGHSLSSLPPNAGRQEILASMQQIDASLQEQIAQIEAKEQDHSRVNVNSASDRSDGQLEDELVAYLRTSAAIQLYTSSLTLHIGQAFKGATLFERKLCFLNSVSTNGNGEGNACSEPLPMPEADSFLNDGIYSTPDACGSNSNDDAAWIEASKNSSQDLFARGPFLPRLSLQRCVHASKQLLAIARQKRGAGSHQPGLAPLGKQTGFPSIGSGGPEPNPFNACSYVLISFTLLMQALAIAGRNATEGDEDSEFSDDDQDEDEMDDGNDSQDTNGFRKERNDLHSTTPTTSSGALPLSRDLLDSARQAAVLSSSHPGMESTQYNHVPISNSGSSGGASSRASQQRMARLEQLWNGVAEARGVLEQTAITWDMALPMFEEVNLCLRTSQLLLNQ